MSTLGRGLVVAGLGLVVVGLLLTLGPSIPLFGRLPGDLRIERPGLRIYVPITSCILVSAAVSAAFWVFSKLR